MSDAVDANLAKQVVQRVTDRARGLASEIAGRIGEPVDMQGLKQAEMVRLWNMPNPQANPMQVQQLIAQGQHSQALDLQFPWRNKLIGAGSPEARVKRAQQLADMAAKQQGLPQP